jgi:SAM-dependent methyltransferase
MDLTFAGSGPGVQARDGCSVELYRQLPYLGELEPVLDFLKPKSSVLELGCGTGRLTRVLMELGLQPAGVDNSAEMLRHLPAGVRAVQGDVETLALQQQFDIVLIASCLVNHPDDSVREAFIASAARHAKPGAILLVERHDAEWLRTAPAGWQVEAGPAQIHVDDVERAGAITKMRLRYVLDDQSWTQDFAAVALEESDVEQLVRAHGFVTSGWHGPRRRWLSASYDSAS